MRRTRFFGKIVILAIFVSIFLFSHAVLAQTPISSLVEVDSTTTSAVSTTSNIEEAMNAASTSFSEREFIPEPTIRVGLYKTKEPVKFTSDFIYEVWINNEFVGALFTQDNVVLSYKNGVYNLNSDSLSFTSSKYIRLVPQDSGAFFTLTNYSRPVKGRGKINFNVYRGTLEYRYSAKSSQPYVINELPLDEYVLGVAETYNTAPQEYVKALMVAARSYAYALTSKLPPTDKRMFDVYPTTVDQIYLGYNSELFMPRVAQAAADTAGEMVTYHGNPVITPYFSHSNGATKSWKGKDRPWLKSVKAVYDKGKTMYGHGIGMSNYDAEKHAKKDGWTYDQILQYYYSSTTVEKVY
jgi:hypothetical protein